MNNIVNSVVKFTTKDDEELFLYEVDKILKSIDIVDCEIEILKFVKNQRGNGIWNFCIDVKLDGDIYYVTQNTKNGDMIRKLGDKDPVYEGKVILKLLKENREDFLGMENF